MVDGRDAAFTAFVAEHRTKLVRTAFLLCGDWARAEDVTQVALGRLYGSWGRVRQSHEAYARTIVTRSAVDESRRPWRREVSVDNEYLRERDVGSGCFEDALADRLHLDEALRRLPPRQRQVVVLRHYWNLSVVESAEELGLSAGTVKSHCSRALERLSELLGPDVEELRRR